MSDASRKKLYNIAGPNGTGKTSIMEAINYCLYGAKADEIYRNINRRERAMGNANVVFELVMEMDDGAELIIKRSWSAGAVAEPKPRDLTERLVVVRDGKRVSVQNQEIADDDHSEVRLKSSLEAALGIQNINRLASDLSYIKQEERKGFVEISDEDLEFKQSELKKEKSKLGRKELQTEIARLEPWQVVSRSSDKTEEFVKFTAEVFYKNH